MLYIHVLLADYDENDHDSNNGDDDYDDDDDEDDVDIGRDGAAAKRCAECLLLDFTMNKFPPTSPSLLLPVPSPPPIPFRQWH